MKFNTAILFFLGSSNAFLPRATWQHPGSALFLQDTSQAVEAAMEATDKFGKTSPEARLAWNVVEELDAANSHEKAMAKQIQQQQAEIERLQKLVTEKVPPTVHTDTSDAVKNALEASRLYGKTSPEARMAWDIVEELDASNSHHRSENVHTAQPAPTTESVADTRDQSPEKKLPKTLDEAISAAMLSTKIYGSHAVESRMAWELVEEMESSSSHRRDEVQMKKTPAAKETATAQPATEQPTMLLDTSKAVQAALEASRTFGKASVEARMAWEVVEEMSATRAHHKTVGSG